MAAWTDSGMDWTNSDIGRLAEWIYFDALLHAYIERRNFHDGVDSATTYPKRGAPYLASGGNDGATIDFTNICRTVRQYWFVNESSVWVDRRTLDYDAINGTPFASHGITAWTRTSMRKYLEDEYGYGALWDQIMSVVSLTGDFRPLFMMQTLSWRWMHFFYVLLNLLTVKFGSYAGTTSGVKRLTRFVNEANWPAAIAAFNALASTESNPQTSRNYASHYGGDSRQILREAGTINLHCGNGAGTAAHDIRLVAVSKLMKYQNSYVNNDFAGAEDDAWIVVDGVAVKNYQLNSRILEEYQNDAATVPDSGSGVFDGWVAYVQSYWGSFALADAGITGGFSYQDDTV
jgi:hypothetical protein